MTTTDYKKDRAKLVAEARSLQEKADAEGGRDLTAEEVDQFNSKLAAVKALDDKHARTAKLEAVEAFMKESAGRISNPEPIHEDVERYSILRAIDSVVRHGRVTGLEAEVSDEIAKKLGKAPSSFFVPHNLGTQKFGQLDITSGAGAISTKTDYGNFIDLLRNKMLVRQLGARILSDLSGNIQIPTQTGAGTAYWTTGGTSGVTASEQAIDQVDMSPSMLGAQTKYTRNFLRQTSVDAEQFVRDDLTQVLALEMDRAVYNGSGSGAEPEGLLQNSDVETVALGTDGGAPTFAKMVEMETQVAIANADIGSLAYVLTPAGRGKCKTVEVASTTGRFIWESNSINGYSAYATNQLPSNLTKGYGTNLSAGLYGNWNDVLIGLWGATDVLVNPYTGDAAGSVLVTVIQDCDIAFRHPESFSKIVDMITS